MRNISRMINTTRYICTCCSVRWIYDHESFPGGSDGKESACNEGDLGVIPGLGRFPWRGNSYPLQYSGLENSWTEETGGLQFMGSQRVRQLSDFHFTFVKRLPAHQCTQPVLNYLHMDVVKAPQYLYNLNQIYHLCSSSLCTLYQFSNDITNCLSTQTKTPEFLTFPLLHSHI